MEVLVLKMVFANDNGEKSTVIIKDVLETISEALVVDLMDKIIQTGFVIKGQNATIKDSAQLVKTTIEDLDIE